MKSCHFLVKESEIGVICDVDKLTQSMLLTSLIISNASKEQMNEVKLNKVKGTPDILNEATPRQLITAIARSKQKSMPVMSSTTPGLPWSVGQFVAPWPPSWLYSF